MKNTVSLLTLLSLFAFGCSSKTPQQESNPNSGNYYSQVNLVANRADFHPEIIEPDLQNAWGLANRPAGLGGHFWVTTQKTGKSIQYVGDVGGKKLFQDDLKIVNLLEKKKTPSTPTGVVFNPSTKFVITQPSPEGSFKSESKFIFVTDSGKVYGWAEKKKEDGKMLRPSDSVLMSDHQKRGDQYFGCAIDSKGEKLFVADFGTHPQMRAFDFNFKEMKLAKDKFKNPFIKGAYTKAGEYGPYNVQIIPVNSQDHVFVAYAQIEKDPKTGKLEAGEEQKGAGLGKLVEYDLDGNLVQIWNDKGLLNAPWGITQAPATGFGVYSGNLLVGNFGDGTIVAFDPKTHEAVDYLKTSEQAKVQIDGLWGLMFGNGASLGEKDHLYFAAGPNDETDGLFGKIQVAR
jgi:uncharacterized protein (TIGR03118 family)